MIEDKEIGMKLAESEEEAFWNEAKKATEEIIKTSKNNLLLNEALLETIIKKCDQYN